MSRLRPTPLAQTAEHRAQHGGDVPPPAPLLAVAAKPEAMVRPPGAGLSLRERRVKAILLKELKRTTQGMGLTYNERQKLVKTLDVAFIDAELAKMRRQIRWLPKVLFAGTLVLGLFFAFAFGTDYARGEIGWGSLLIGLFPLLSSFVSPVLQHRALRRKIFIYEALRELSDADERDVVLDDTVKQADLLIDRIVERELAADAWLAAARAPRRN